MVHRLSISVLSLLASLAHACTPANTPDSATSDASEAGEDSAPDARGSDALPEASPDDASAHADVSSMDADASDSGALTPVDAAAEAGLPARCTGPYREVERATIVDDMPMVSGTFIGGVFFDGASLWFSIESASNSGSGSYDPRVYEARGWGSAVTVARASARLPAWSSTRATFGRTNGGAPLVWLGSDAYNASTGALLQLGLMYPQASRVAVLPAETWVIHQDEMGGSREVIRFDPMTAAPAAPPARIGAFALPALPPGALSLFRTPDGATRFVGVGGAAGASGTAWQYQAMDSSFRPVGDLSASVLLNDSPIVSNTGLWFVNRVVDATTRYADLHHIGNDGRDRVFARFVDAFNTFLETKILSANDDTVMVSGDGVLRLIDPNSGGVMQTISDAHKGTIAGNAIFVVGSGGGSTVLIRRMVCN